MRKSPQSDKTDKFPFYVMWFVEGTLRLSGTTIIFWQTRTNTLFLGKGDVLLKTLGLPTLSILITIFSIHFERTHLFFPA